MFVYMLSSSKPYTNSRSKFTNEINSHINTDITFDKTLYLSLCSISFDNIGGYVGTPQTYIHILCNVVNQSITSSGYLPTIGRISSEIIGQRDYIEYIPKTLHYYKINKSSLKQIEITLVDEEGQQVQFAPGLPTIVKLYVTMDPSQDDYFYVQVRSSRNSIGNALDFHAQLPTHLTDMSKYEVALSSMQIPSKWENLSKEDAYIDIHEHKNHYSEYKLMRFYFSSGNYKNIETLLKAIRFAVSSEGRTLMGYCNIKLNPKRPETVVVERMISTLLRRDDIIYYLHIPHKLAIMLGFKSITSSEVKPVSLKLFTKRLQTADFPHLVNYSDSRLILLYADFITPSIVSESRLPVLKFIHLSGDQHKDIEAREYEHLDFVGVNRARLNTLHFKLLNHEGKQASIKIKSDTILNLIFRKKHTEVNKQS